MGRESGNGGLPEEGCLVEVRGQNWVVSQVHSAPQGASPSTLLDLQSVADGHYGEKLSVIWEVEPGRRVLPAGSLPDVSQGAFDSPDRLAAFLDAVRWSAVASADVRTLQAPFRSGVAVEPYQLEPVARAIGAPRVNLLLADDVGLGKTIEAGLVAQELLLRERAKRIMVVAPAGLTLKWRDELAEKFGLDFQIVDSAACAELRRTHGTTANPFRAYPRTIVSLPWLRGPKAQRLLDEVVPQKPDEERTGPDERFFDLLILDEAHHVAPAAPKQLYAVDSQQTRLIRRLAPHFAHRLFLSATPHNGFFESYTALLEIIDDQRFLRGMQPDDRTERETVVRRLKREIRDAGGDRFQQREAVSVPVEYTPEEREVHALLGQFATLRKNSLGNGGGSGSRAADLVTLLLKKRLFSSPAAFLHTVRVYLARLEEGSGTGGRRVPGPGNVDGEEVPDWLDDFAGSLEGLDDEEVLQEEDAALGRATRLAPLPDPEAVELLRSVERWAVTHEATADSKARRLIDELKAVCRPDGERWVNERVVVFTEYRDTQRWLYDLLEQEGLAEPGRVAELHGGITKEDREQVRLSFQSPPDSPEGKVRILLATDAAGEGIDLQKHCHRLVNYDIPFNPNKLEQRIGRIDRWGQDHNPVISHFVGSGWEDASADSYDGDLEFLSRMARKVAQVEADLGSVNPVLADAVQRRMTGDRTAALEGSPASRGNRHSGTRMAAQPGVSDQVARLAGQYNQSVRELGITPENIHRVVATALELDRQQPLRPVAATSPAADALFADMEDDPDGPDLSGSLFEVPPLTGSWERATRGLTHKLRPDQRRPVTFDSRIAAEGRDDVVLAHLAHPLVSMSTRLLTAAVWKPDTVGLHRVAAVVSDRPELETTLVSAYARFVLVGNDGVRLHEEILHAGGWVGESGWIRRWQNVNTQREVLQQALTQGDQAAPHLRESLAARWPGIQERLTDSLRARRTERLQAMTAQLAARESEEQQRINASFDRFDANLRAKLHEEGTSAGEQTALFSERELTVSEARQYREDRERSQARRETLERDRARELAAVSARYRDPQPHLFPVAVVFVVPAKEASQ